MITLEQRIAKIKSIEDIDKEIKKAKNYANQLKRRSKNPELTFDEKLRLNEKVKEAEKIHQELKLSAYALEDKINNSNNTEN